MLEDCRDLYECSNFPSFEIWLCEVTMIRRKYCLMTLLRNIAIIIVLSFFEGCIAYVYFLHSTELKDTQDFTDGSKFCVIAEKQHHFSDCYVVYGYCE
jgi:hypothetical protein